MARRIYLTEEQETFLYYVVGMYKELHEESWREGINPEEEGMTNKIMDKLEK